MHRTNYTSPKDTNDDFTQADPFSNYLFCGMYLAHARIIESLQPDRIVAKLAPFLSFFVTELVII